MRYFWASFIIALYLIIVLSGIIMEKRTHPSWYGTYYSFHDAIEDGWYEQNEKGEK